MSNHRHAYGWSGHIITSTDETDSNQHHNLVAVPPDLFKALADAYYEDTLDDRVEVKQLGVTNSDTIFLACGSSFSDGFTYYGTVFQEAESRSAPGPQSVDHDTEYLKAMKDVYGIDLPPCQLMIGCSSEH